MRYYLSICVVLFIPLCAWSQAWNSMQGPEGNIPTAILLLSPDYLEILTGQAQWSWSYNGGIYKSYNQGARWVWRNKGIKWPGHIHQMDQDPFNPDVIYAAHGGSYWASYGWPMVGQVVKSTDRGETWFSIAPYDSIWWAVHCSRRHPNVVLISGSEGVYRSTNGGQTWQYVGGIHGTEFAYDPSHPDTIYLGSVSDYLCRSTNGGLTWVTDIGNSLPTSCIFSIAVDPQNSSIIYAVPALWSDQFGVYRSSDYGASWYSVLDSSVWFVRVSPVNPNIVWAGGESGVYLSTDRGFTWTRKFSKDTRAVTPFPNNENGICIGTRPDRSGPWGFVVSTDLGNTWEMKRFRAHGLSVGQILLPFRDNYKVVYTVANGNLQKTTDNGASWLFLPTSFKPLSIDGRADTIICGGGQGGIWKSTNGGNSWAQSSGLTSLAEVREVRFHKANPRHVWAAVSNNSNEWGIWKSTDFRMSGQGTNLPTYAIATHPQDSNIVLAGTVPYLPFVWDLIVRTADGGATWQIVYNGGVSPSLNGVLTIEFDPENPNIVYAGGATNRIIKSTDGGITWDYNLPLLPRGICREIALSPLYPNNVFVAGDYVYRSTDGGLSWIEWSGDLWDSASLSINVFTNGTIYLGNLNGLYYCAAVKDTQSPSISVIQPNGGEVLYIGYGYNIRWSASDNTGVDGVDIFYSIDNGINYSGIAYNEVNDGSYNWTVPNTPSDYCYMKVRAYDYEGNTRADISDGSFIIGQIDVGEAKNQNVSSIINIKGTINPILVLKPRHLSSSVDFAIYDCTGSLVYRFAESSLQVERRIKLNNLSSGVYFYTLTEGGTTTKGKFVVIK